MTSRALWLVMAAILGGTGCSFNETPCLTVYPDGDGDGYGDSTQTQVSCAPLQGWTEQAGDCDDTRAQVNPGAQETCNGLDDDCDQSTDDGVLTTWYADADGDGYGDDGQSFLLCEAPEGAVAAGGDCDDSDETVRPGGVEICNERDDNCDGEVDEGVTPSWCQDADGDGFGNPGARQSACEAPARYVEDCSDCNDLSDDDQPGGEERCDGADNDCDGVTDEVDVDQDGEAPLACGGQDCDDGDDAILPGQEEICNDTDDDCDSEIDEGLLYPLYPDTDGDGYGVPGGAISTCTPQTGYVEQLGDCDNGDGQSYPGAPEVCDAQDNNCDLLVDNIDADEDGAVTAACGGTDCDDFNAGIGPTATERCNGVDDDCDGVTDQVDADGDGEVAQECGGPDCVDSDAEINTEGEERCDGADDNCNGLVDEGVRNVFYRDADGDGFGQAQDTTAGCAAPPGYSEARGDCDDAAPEVHPGAADSAADSVDSDCGGTTEPEPHVHLAADSFDTLQGALDAADPGSIVWVGPGVYNEYNVSFNGKAATLISTHGADQTVIDANGLSQLKKRSVLIFNQSETTQTVVDGFTLTDGYNDNGGGMRISASSPRLVGLIFSSNTSIGQGGGVAISSGATPELEGCWFVSNRAGLTDSTGQGGAMAITGASPVIQDALFFDNRASQGGGLFVQSNAAPQLTHALFASNYASAFGGGGVYVAFVSEAMELSYAVFWDNLAQGVGGGLQLFASSPTLRHLVVVDNGSNSGGGGIGLVADIGSTVTASPLVSDSVLAYNRPENLESLDYPLLGIVNLPDMNYNNFYLEGGGTGVEPADLFTGNLNVEPGFVEWDAEGGFSGLIPDFHLRDDSGLRDKGDPFQGEDDPDGSKPDIGVYGGALADARDLDGDGRPDWFWTGALSAAPDGFLSASFDCLDLDPALWSCGDLP